MSRLHYHSTWTAPPVPEGAAVTALAGAEIDGVSYLLALDAGAQVLRVFQAGTTLVQVDTRPLAEGSRLGHEAELALGAFPAGLVALLPGLDRGGLPAVSLGSGGVTGPVGDLPGAVPAGIAGAQAISFADGRNVLVTVSAEGGQLDSYRVGTDGVLQAADTSSVPQGSLLAAAEFGSGAVILTAGVDNTLESLRVQADGTLTRVTSLGADDGLFIAAPTDLDVLTLPGGQFALLGSAGSQTLSVARVLEDGQLRLTDQVLDTLVTRFGGVTELAGTTSRDRGFVVAGGADDGLSLFELLPDGTLLHLHSLADDLTMTLTDIAALSATVNGPMIDIVAAGQSSGDLTRLQVEIGNLASPLTGGPAAETLSGGAGDDLLFAAAGDDVLSGGAGDDILVGGAGADVLTGGDGADIFVFRAGEMADRITDFEPGRDRIDFSGLGRVYSIEALEIVPTARGAVITYGDARLEIETRSGTTLAPNSLLLADLFPVSHTDIGPPITVRWGTGAGDRLEGDAFEDRIIGLLGDDLVLAGGGNDTIYGGDGRDTISGGEGDDFIDAGNWADFVRGGGGNDVIGGGAAFDTVYGDGGNDRIYGGSGQDMLRGGDGEDYIDGGEWSDDLSGDAGDDTLMGGVGFDTLDGGDGSDHLVGGIGGDVLIGAAGDDTLIGGDGRNRLTGGEGRDSLLGGSWNDFAEGGAGADTIFGGAGADTLLGHAGGDVLWGGAGADRLIGGLGEDTLRGGTWSDTIFGQDDADRIYGEEGHDLLSGDGGNDTLIGGDGADTIGGGAGDDLLLGGDWADRLFGSTGNDTLHGGAGNDILTGGTGADWFVFSGGRDTVADFEYGLDVIVLDREQFGDGAVPTPEIRETEEGTRLIFHGFGEVFLADLEAASALSLTIGLQYILE